MKKFNSSKRIIIGIILVIIIVFLVSFSSMQRNQQKKTGKISGIANDVVAVVDRGISFPLRAIENSVRSVGNLFSTYEENDRLKKRLDNFAALESQNQMYKHENQKLKEQLTINEALYNYEKINASVISRSPDTWQDILIIDRGKQDGIEANMSVLGSQGLIGRVIVANEHSSKVELLTTTNQNSDHFPVMVTPETGEAAYGLMGAYDEVEEAFVVTQLTTMENLKPGDSVTTSGLGGGSPKGLLVGTVKKIKPTSFGLDKEIYITPVSSMYDISVVTVVKRLAEGDVTYE